MSDTSSEARTPGSPTTALTGDLCEVVITAPDAGWLADCTRRLVDQRLAACGHIITRIRSVYRWEGSIHDEPEARVALHTRQSLVDAITAEVAEHHPYVVPCVIALPITGEDTAYHDWIRSSTRAEGDQPTAGWTVAPT